MNNTYTHLEVEAALCIWECLDARSTNQLEHPSLAAYRSSVGTAELRHLSIRLAAYCLAIYNRLPDTLTDGLAYDWEIIPALLDTIDWTRIPELPTLEDALNSAKVGLRRLRKSSFRQPDRVPQLAGAPIMPPAEKPARALQRRVFDKQFKPMALRHGDVLRESLPAHPHEHHWWTAVPALREGDWHIHAGIFLRDGHFYIKCRNPWGGRAEDQPVYVL
jgi:hypothetical protein